MSTKPFPVLLSTPDASFPDDISSGLCNSLFPDNVEKGVAFKEFPEKQLRISVRPFNLVTDVAILYKWMSQEYAGPLTCRPQHPEELEESYASMIESDFAQPFMGLVNETPVCQIDVYKTQQDVVSLYYNARPGDYGIQLTLDPLTIQPNVAILLNTCLEYFFSFPEVGRIIADIDGNSEWNNALFKKAGFRSMKKIQGPYKSSTLYCCTRETFCARAK